MDLEKVGQLLEIGKEGIKKDAKNYILFRDQYNENIKDIPICTSCPDGFNAAYNYFYSVYLQKIKSVKNKKPMDQNAKFQLKPGGIIHSGLSPTGTFTPDNITDEDAIHLLQETENYIQSFSKYPENWRDIISKEKTHFEKVTGKKPKWQLEKEAAEEMKAGKKSETVSTDKTKKE